jgi:hypothetical protein
VAVSFIIVTKANIESMRREEMLMKLRTIAQLSFLPAISVIRKAVNRGIIIK